MTIGDGGTADDRDDELETLAPSQFGEQDGGRAPGAELGSEADGPDGLDVPEVAEDPRHID